MPVAFHTREVPPVAAGRPGSTIYHILPDSLAQPVWLGFFGFLPWLVLLAVNFYLLHLVWGEMSGLQRDRAHVWLGAGIALAVLHGGIAALRQWRHTNTKLPELGGLVALGIGYLWLTVSWCGRNDMVPASVSQWILPPENLMGLQFCLVAPPLFYGLLRLACFETRSRFLAGPLAALMATLLGPVVVFGFSFLLGLFSALAAKLGFASLFAHGLGGVGAAGMAGVFILLTAVTLAGALRLGAGTFLWTRGMSPLWTALLHGAFCLLMPLGGLALNVVIPFPTDFQSVAVYLLTLLNGAILTCPVPADARWRRVRWVSLAVSFPFSLYFFLVFLPWMPLALPAMVGFGAGFLILAPIFLFAVHLQELLLGWQRALDEGGGLRPHLVVLGAVAILPGFLLAQSFADRAALRSALDYAYRAPYGESSSGVDAARAAATLEKMRGMQQGLYLPFLSDAYKAIVFDGMVLQQEKIRHLHRLFAGSDLAAVKPAVYQGFYRQNATIQNRPMFNPFAEGRVKAQPAHVAADGVAAGGWTRHVIDLGLRNEVASPGEYVGRLQLPEGVWVTGLELDLNGTMVPARIFEKKTALWVYQKIRDTEFRRDPGLVFYRDDGMVEVRVFPFTAYQSRPARLHLWAAPGVVPRFRLDGAEVLRSSGGAVLPAAGPKAARAVSTPQGTLVVLPPDSFPADPRPRALHFVVDRSVNGMDAREAAAAMRRVVEETGITDVRVTEANHRSWTHAARPGSSDEFPARFELERSGGFAFERAVKSVLAAAARSGADPAEPGPALVFVAVTKEAGALVGEERGRGWLRLVEDVDAYGVVTPSSLVWKQWRDGKASAQPAVRAVGVLKRGATIRTVGVSGTTRLAAFPGPAEEGIQLWDGAQWVPVEAPAAGEIDAKVVAGLEAWMAAESLDFFPEREEKLFPEAVRLAREAGWLTVPTSLMIVENSAQWKMLERKEKQKTETAKEFDFEEEQPVVPEPETWLMLLLGVGAVALSKRWQRKQSIGSDSRVG